MRTVFGALVGLVLVSTPVAAQESAAVATWTTAVVDPPVLGNGPDDACARPADAHAEGREIAELSGAACLTQLERLGIPHEAAEPADGVATPIRVTGPILGVELTGDRGPLDCRLVAALAAWAPELRAAGIRQLRAMSIHRPGARVRRSGRVSGHAYGLALDLGGVVLEDGTACSVLDGWEAREPGADPCAVHDEGPTSARLRAAVCAAARQELFQVVLTPHHDRTHQNHLHLELVPGVRWSYVH